MNFYWTNKIGTKSTRTESNAPWPISVGTISIFFCQNRMNTWGSTFWSRKECEGDNHVKSYINRDDFGPLTFFSKFLIIWPKILRSRDFGPLSNSLNTSNCLTKMDQKEFWVTWSKISERKSVDQNRVGIHMPSRDYLLHTLFWTKKWTPSSCFSKISNFWNKHLAHIIWTIWVIIGFILYWSSVEFNENYRSKIHHLVAKNHFWSFNVLVVVLFKIRF